MSIQNQLSIVLILMVTSASICFGDEYTFRNTLWGMSVEQVKSSEKIKPEIEEKNRLGYKTNLLGKDMILLYIFVENKLVRAKYILKERHMNKNDYINDFMVFKEVLTKKYGLPNQNEVIWKKDLYKDDPQNYGLAISMGHCLYYSSWDTNKTEITLGLFGDNFDVTCGIEYVGKDYRELEEKEEEKKALESF